MTRDFDEDDVPVERSHEPSLARLIAARIGRREMVTGLLGLGAAGALGVGFPGAAALAATRGVSTLKFRSPKHAIGADHALAPGHAGQVLIRWGDPVLAGAPGFDATRQTAAAQKAQFGYNNDFMAFMPLPRGSNASDHGLLCVSHEYTMAELMWPGLTVQTRADKVSREQADVEIAAHGHSILEVRKSGNAWTVVAPSRFARRLTGETEMRLSGPAAGAIVERAENLGSGRIGAGLEAGVAGGGA